MLPCVWRCMNQRMDSSLQFNGAIVLRHFHLWHEGAEDLLPTAYLYTPACNWAQRTNCCLLAILPSADADELVNCFLGSSPMQMDWFSRAKPAHSLEPRVADKAEQQRAPQHPQLLGSTKQKGFASIHDQVGLCCSEYDRTKKTKIFLYFFPIYCPGIPDRYKVASSRTRGFAKLKTNKHTQSSPLLSKLLGRKGKEVHH